MKLVSYQNDPGGTLGQQAQFANSAAPAAAVLSNSVPSYTTLGGKYLFSTLAGAETDFALFGYQVAAEQAVIGRKLWIGGISISAVNIGAIVATTATVLEWGIAVNSTAASLATVDGGGTSGVFGPRRMALGSQAFLVGAGIGGQSTDLVRTFNSLLVVENLRFLHIILRLPIGTATASQQIRGAVTIDGYWGT